MMTPEALANLVLSGLGSYRDSVVLAGGFARSMYQLDPAFTDVGLQATSTNDVDFAVSTPLAIVEGRRVHEILMGLNLVYISQAGLDHRTITCRYYAPGTNPKIRGGPYVEFITPLKRKESEEPFKPQADELAAAALRYVELLLHEPIEVIDPLIGKVRLPHPLGFILQKTLIRTKRELESKQAKDQADLFFVLVSYRSEWESWKPRWDSMEEHSDSKPWRNAAVVMMRKIYATQVDVGVKEVLSAFPQFGADGVVRVVRDFLDVMTTTRPPLAEDGA